MIISEQIKWINENQEWIESLNPYSFSIDRQKGKVSIHASNNEETKKYFEERKSNAFACLHKGDRFHCIVIDKDVEVSAIFSGKEIREMKIENFGEPF